MATFKINKVFKITNRGHVLSGIIVDGEISSGDLLLLDVDRDILRLKIKSVEYVDYSKGYAEIGLMIGPLENNIQTLLETMTKQIILITRDHTDS